MSGSRVCPAAGLAEGKPLPEELALVVEVADSSLRVDRRLKLPLYASAGIPVTWLVDLTAGRIEIHGEPDAAERRYTTVQLFEEGTTVPLPWGGDVAFDELLLR